MRMDAAMKLSHSANFYLDYFSRDFIKHLLPPSSNQPEFAPSPCQSVTVVIVASTAMTVTVTHGDGK